MIRIFYIAVLILASLTSWGQQGMLLAVPADGEAFLLDTYPGAEAAYGLNQLKSTATLCCTIQRADGDTLDVGFSAGDFDSSSAGTFVSTGDGWITRLYDQTGNGYDLTATDTTKAPQVYISGTLVTDNGQAAMYADGSDLLTYPSPGIYSGAAHSTFFVTNLDSSIDNFEYLIDQGTGSASDGGVFFRRYSTSNRYDNVDDALNRPTAGLLAINSQFLGTSIRTGSGGDLSMFINGTINDTDASGTDSALSRALGLLADSDGGNYLDGYAQVLIIYNSDQSSNRTAIETILNNYYSIY